MQSLLVFFRFIQELEDSEQGICDAVFLNNFLLKMSL
jgi:hypothetical protein